MKNMAVNQKLILLMLMTAFLMCWAQGVSHGGGGGGAIGGAIGAVGGAVGTAVGAVGAGIGAVGTGVGAALGAAGTAIGVAAGAVLIAVGVVDLGVRLIATVVWHTDSLSSMTVFPNGGIIGVVVSNLIHLGDSYTVAPHTTLTYSSTINNIAFSPINPLLASGSVDNTVQLWNRDTQTLLSTLREHTDSVVSVAFSPDGSLLASGSADDTIRLWNPITDTLLATLRGHTSDVLSVAFSPDGSLLASGGADGTVRLWNPVTETLEATLEAHMDSVLSVAFSPDGSLLASGSADGLVGLWDTHTEILQATLGHESPVLSVAFSPDSDLLATGSTDGVARLWDPHMPEHKATLGHDSPVESVAFDGNTLVTGSQDGRVRQWEVTSETTPASATQRSGSVCQVGDILAPGASCTYPGTDATFSVLDNGNAQLDIPGLPSWFDNVSIGGSLSITTTINGESYHLVATELSSGSWKIEELGDSSDSAGDQTPGGSESHPDGITASTMAPLTETTLHESVVTLTLSGGTYEHSSFRIGDAITLSGISGVTVGTFGVDRVSDTQVTVELEFNGDFDTDATLTFAVGADAIANYSGSAFTAQIPVSASTESLVVSTAAPLTEATLEGSIITLTLSGRQFVDEWYIGDAITLSGIDGVTFDDFWGLDRVSDTVVTIELTFNGAFDTDATLTVTVGAGAIAGYGGSAFTAQIPVSASTESLVVSTEAPLTEATLEGSIITLTLSGRQFVDEWYIGDAITLSGIDGVTFDDFWGLDRVSDTVVTIELTFNGNIQTDSTLTFTVSPEAIVGYSGSAFTAQLPVTAGPEADANNDGVVDIQDLVLVASNYGKTGTNSADINGDGVVDINDLTTVAGVLDSVGSAPSAHPQALEMFTAADIKLWLSHARQRNLTNPTALKGILFLEQLLAALIPKETILLPNYPNPFNPETWIPYHLATEADVTLTIYDMSGQVVRQFALGHQAAGRYQSRSRAVHWDGRNEFSEQVASGVYFYHLSAGNYSAMRKMVILK